MVLKILGYGFLFGKTPYIRDAWNILDFVIVLSGYATLINEMGDKNGDEESAVSLTGLRVFRVMRPLKSISSIRGLKVLV